MPVVCLIAPQVEGAEGEVCVLSEVRKLPDDVLIFIQRRFPSFRLKYSKTVQASYYANTCPKCGVLSGDFYLHAEPGAPFFPETEEDAKRLTLEEIPMSGSVGVEASPGMGVGDLILAHATRRNAAQVTAPNHR
ncbi:MAG: hypothetical protein A3F74_01805 [Betaproteobacteria bacterium RIFCSPLOWO2_12_FULL_62_58]|nr:MAG: hypothetical protein A3F74_01805 [Betaproteobacteria bacterium RIFCSPLOWO2_12_FULL_62_58]